MIQPALLTYEQAGTRLGVSGSTVRRLVRAGRLRAVFPSSRPRIENSEIDRYILQISAPNVVKFAKPRATAGRISRQQAADLLI